jgi:uncharacterized protein (UPF0335 family)
MASFLPKSIFKNASMRQFDAKIMKYFVKFRDFTIENERATWYDCK